MAKYVRHLQSFKELLNWASGKDIEVAITVAKDLEKVTNDRGLEIEQLKGYEDLEYWDTDICIYAWDLREQSNNSHNLADMMVLFYDVDSCQFQNDLQELLENETNNS
jgi:hypothetical protein